MKKIIAICLVVILAATAVIGGTLAYFTDKDNATNTFTVGGVDIDLHEANKEKTPAVDEEYHEWLEDQVLFPGDNETNTIAKRVYVENTGVSEAYVRVHIAIPTVLDNAQPDFDASKNLLHFNAEEECVAEGKWNWGKKVVAGRTGFVGTGDEWNYYTTKITDKVNGKDKEIDYNVYVVTYETPVQPEKVTDDAMHQVYLYKDATNEDIQKANAVLGNKWNIHVFAEGGQTEGFDNAFEALNTQFGTPSAENNPWVK